MPLYELKLIISNSISQLVIEIQWYDKSFSMQILSRH